MKSKIEQFKDNVRLIYRLFVVFFSLVGLLLVFLVYLMLHPEDVITGNTDSTSEYVSIEESDDEEWDKIENGIHVRTGLVDGEGLMAVVNNCTNCHSAKLVTQNRMSAEQWAFTIDWMQETQNLWNLGANEEIIINYLVTNYPVRKQGRRGNLKNIEWYVLED